MLSVPTNNRLINRSYLFHGDKYVSSVAHQCLCHMSRNSTSFQEPSSDESISQIKEAGTRTFPRRLVVYDNASKVQYYSPHPNDLKRLAHQFRPTKLNGREPLDKQLQAQTTKAGHFYHREIRREAPKAHLNEKHNIVITENPAYRIVYASRKKNVKSPSVQGGLDTLGCFQSAEKVKAEIYEALQKGFCPAEKKELFLNKEVDFLKPSAYHSRQTGLPVPMGNRDHSTLGIQSSVDELGPQTSHKEGELKRHFAVSTWPRSTPLVDKNFVEPMANDIRAPEVARTHSIANFPRGIAYTPQQKPESSIQQARCHPSTDIVENGSRPEVPSLKYPPYDSSLRLQQHIQSSVDVPVVRHHVRTAAAFQGVQARNPNVNSLNGSPEQHFESAKCTKCASPNRIFVDLPVRCPDASTGGDGRQKAISPVIPTPCAAFPPASYPSYHDKGDIASVQTFYAESYTTQKAQQNIDSFDDNLPFKVYGHSQHTDFTPDTSACGCSEERQINECQYLTIRCAQCFRQPTSEIGYSQPLRSGKRSDVTHFDGHEPLLYHPKPAPILLVLPRDQTNTQALSVYHTACGQALQMSRPHGEPKDSHVPSEPYKTCQSHYNRFHHQQLNNSREDRASLGNHSQDFCKHQMSKQTSVDTCESRDPSCASDVMGKAPYFSGVDSPSTVENTPNKFHDSRKMEAPLCYISVDSKPQVPHELEKEQRSFSRQEQWRFQLKSRIEQSPESTKPFYSTNPDDTVTKLMTFVVGLETEIQSPKKKRNPTSPSKNQMQIVNISCPQRTEKLRNGTPLDSSATDCDDSVDMIRLERVYYLAHSQSSSLTESNRPALSAAPHLMFNKSGFDCQSWKFSAFPVNGQLKMSENEVITVGGKACINKEKAHNNATFPSPRKRKGAASGDKGGGRLGAKRKKPAETVKMILERERYARRWLGKLEIIS